VDDHSRGERIHIWYVQGDDRAGLEAAAASRADAFNIDLEDGVLAPAKPLAREQVRNFLLAHPSIAARSMVRINPVGGTDWALDIATTCSAAHTYLVTMLSSAAELRQLDSELAARERQLGVTPRGIYVVVETAAVVPNLREVLGASPRVRGIVVGQADLTVDVGCEGISENGGFVASALLDWVHGQILFAAAERRIPAFISPWSQASKRDVRVREMRRLFALGYHGMVVASDEAVEDVERAWRPTDEQVAFANGVVEAMREANEQGRGVGGFEGWGMEAPHAEMARQVLRRARHETGHGA
jgi:citrate lyase subunit beta/citryl-CoA lyase